MTTSTVPTTRDRLLEAAETLISTQGFAATSIDQIIERVGITKGAFFYHFKTKADMARALIDRYADADRRTLRGTMERAEKLSEDPLQQLLIFAGLLIEIGEELDAQEQPTCLFATYCYEHGLFDAEIHGVIREAMLEWRKVVGEKLRAAAERYPPEDAIDIDSLADMLTVVFEGGFTLSRGVGGKDVFVQQLRHYRRYLRLLFPAGE